MNVIIFSQENAVAVMSASPNVSLTMLEIGKKDVPDGVPFWIVAAEKLPADIIPDAWELDYESLGEPSGYGGTYSTEQAGNDD